MTKAKKDYRKKTKERSVTFYLHEQELYEFSKRINFAQFVKKALFKAMLLEDVNAGFACKGRNNAHYGKKAK